VRGTYRGPGRCAPVAARRRLARAALSRIRLALELFEHSGEAKYKTDLERDLAELEALIDEILLASRLEAMPALQATEDVDLLALAAEECARYDDCTLDGEAASVTGDPRLLRQRSAISWRTPSAMARRRCG
jgi:signal transduction histidine kinase